MNYLYQINTSKGGVPKLPIEEALIDELGIVGDKQKHIDIHGGPEMAICLFDIKTIEHLQAEGHPITVGSTGENFTLDIENYHDLVPGSKLQIGDSVMLEITSYTTPCQTIKKSFKDEKFIRISQKLYPQQSRLYAKVLKGGLVKKGDSVWVQC
jgi:MOSC domain-containing protein YiiM